MPLSPFNLRALSIEIPDPASIKWSWACKSLLDNAARTGPESYYLQAGPGEPRNGDVALVRVEKLGHHAHIETAQSGRLRLYRGDHLLCSFGNRYATDVYEGHTLGLNDLHLLSGSGVIGTVRSLHPDVGRPTELSFVGYASDAADGRRLNLVDRCFHPPAHSLYSPPVIAVIGTGMSTGKTTVTRKILRSLFSLDMPVAGAKLTGTASPRDLREMRATGVRLATDFSDYGFPSTYGLSLDCLLQLFDCVLNACGRENLSPLIMEVADGLLQRETRMLIWSEEFRRKVRAVVVVGSCSSSALYAADQIRNAGYEIWAASGLFTNSPLFVREFESNCEIPVVPSRSEAEWSNLLLSRMNGPQPEKANGKRQL